MSIFVKIAVYVVIGLILAIADLLFAHRIWTEFRPRENRPPVIAPFRVVGKTADADKIGEVMAQMLVARAHELNIEIDSAIKTLTTKPKPVDSATLAPSPLQLQNYGAFKEPVQVDLASQAPDMKVSFAGVEVTGILAWAQKTVDVDRTVNVSVSFPAPPATKIVAVMSPRSSDSSERWVETKADDDAMLIENLAYAMHKRWMGTSDPLIDAMTLEAFKDYIAALKEAAKLNQSREKVTEQQYESLRVTISRVIDGMPAAKWGAVYEFAAQIAERANHPEQATQYYEREIADGGVADKERQALQNKVADLRKKSAVEDAATAAVQHSSAPSAPLEDLLALLGVKPGALKNQVKIAIINPSPSSIKKVDDPMHEYVDSIEAVVKAIAPDAEIVYGWQGKTHDYTTMDSLVGSIRNAESQGAHVILCPWGPLGKSTSEQRLIQSLASKNIKLILPAGNNPSERPPLASSPLAAQVAVVAATDHSGKPTDFTTRGDSVLWAVGVDVPTKKADGTIGLNAGTSIAAAIAAGMIVRLLGEQPDLDPAHAINLLRSTSKSRAAGTEPLLNLESALDKLHAGG